MAVRDLTTNPIERSRVKIDDRTILSRRTIDSSPEHPSKAPAPIIVTLKNQQAVSGHIQWYQLYPHG